VAAQGRKPVQVEIPVEIQAKQFRYVTNPALTRSAGAENIEKADDGMIIVTLFLID
jgi:hypothetical protein